MCRGCVIEYMEDEPDGHNPDEFHAWMSEVARRPAVIAAAKQVTALYRLPECGTGGPLHVVVDDTNVEDECLHPFRPEEHGMAWTYPAEAYTQAEAVVAALRPLTLVERAVATVIADDEPAQDSEVLR